MFYILNRILARSRNTNKPDIYATGQGNAAGIRINSDTVISDSDPEPDVSSPCGEADDQTEFPSVTRHPVSVTTITFKKVKDSIGLSIVSVKGEHQSEEGVYIKAIIPNGGADLDGRLEVGDQLLSVGGRSLVGLTQERAARYMMDTGHVVTLEVAKGGAKYQGLMPILSNPSPVLDRASEKQNHVIANKHHSSDDVNGNLPSSEGDSFTKQIGKLLTDKENSNLTRPGVNKGQSEISDCRDSPMTCKPADVTHPGVHNFPKRQTSQTHARSSVGHRYTKAISYCPPQTRDNRTLVTCTQPRGLHGGSEADQAHIQRAVSTDR